MNWDWWYYNKLFSIGGPVITAMLAVVFLIQAQLATGVCLLIVAAGQVVAWFYRWIEWREPLQGARSRSDVPYGPNTSSGFRR
ncbi:MAG: hypothetical protein NVS2B16_28030 [Chloroflexota bacterium]